jgi:uncharacterized membrane protein YjjP (DUF1212 family)
MDITKILTTVDDIFNSPLISIFALQQTLMALGIVTIYKSYQNDKEDMKEQLKIARDHNDKMLSAINRLADKIDNMRVDLENVKDDVKELWKNNFKK